MKGWCVGVHPLEVRGAVYGVADEGGVVGEGVAGFVRLFAHEPEFGEAVVRVLVLTERALPKDGVFGVLERGVFLVQGG